jgi:hypothetical protein
MSSHRWFQFGKEYPPSGDAEWQLNPVENDGKENPCIVNAVQFTFDFSPTDAFYAEKEKRSANYHAQTKPEVFVPEKSPHRFDHAYPSLFFIILPPKKPKVETFVGLARFETSKASHSF